MKILLIETIHAEAVSLLSAVGEVVEVEPMDTASAMRQVVDAEAILTRGTGRVPRELLLAGKQLKCVARCGAGTDNIDVATATELGIPVLYSPEGTKFAVAEHALMLMLAAARNLSFLDRAVRQNHWQVRTRVGVGVELMGKTLGVLGLGKIGGRVAELGAAFGMRVFYWSRNSRDERWSYVEPDPLFHESDFLSINLSLNDGTRGFVTAERLAKMKPSSFLINTSRGEIIDEPALVRALEERRIAGAGLDVMAEEPPRPDHPMFALDNVVFTPHLGTITDAAYRNMCVEVAGEAAKILQRKPPDRRNVRNPQVLST